MDSNLLSKYNVPVPRYTSYPTVLHWQPKPPMEEKWERSFKTTYSYSNKQKGISIYIHLPYCEEICYYCGCNKKKSLDHKVEVPYIMALLTEWSLYASRFKERPVISQVHLGGGTPTFFKPKHLEWLVEEILVDCDISESCEMSFEAHPANTTSEHLEVLYRLGFRRISIGVQDFNQHIQTLIGRKQTYSQVKELTEDARKIGYNSINYDVIYGLPDQTLNSITKTIQKVCELRPDRVSYYGFAHTPKSSVNQKQINVNRIPTGDKKQALYDAGKEVFESFGYHAIGMDHFALENDQLYMDAKSGNLHRNFMGYSTNKTDLLIGLGVSSISDSWGMLVQNTKSLKEYFKAFRSNSFPLFRGHTLSEQDLVIRKNILDLMCNYETVLETDILNNVRKKLTQFIEDELITLDRNKLTVTQKGKIFVRNICSVLDQHYIIKPEQNIFSKAI